MTADIEVCHNKNEMQGSMSFKNVLHQTWSNMKIITKWPDKI
jgi:hypothetical protein